MKTDFIIVGGGLSGSILAYTLMKEGKTVVVIDDYLKGASSMVAAGLYNPVVFKRVVKSWKADELIPFLENFYGEIEKAFTTSFHYKANILKVFTDEEEIAFWKKKAEDPTLQEYISAEIDEDTYHGKVDTKKGFTRIRKSGYIDVPVFLQTLHQFFIEKECFRNERFSYNDLEAKEDCVLYKGITAGKVIFCEGHQATQNPWFSYANFKLTKGETININTPLDLKKEVLNKGVFLMPLQGQSEFLCGATYEWQDLSGSPTEKGKEELTQKLEKLLLEKYAVTKHSAGIRPTVSDRRPVMGTHPIHNSLVIFNGMGTKGVMLAPFLAKKLAEYLLLNTPLDKEIDVNRFYKP